jgi:hypothetical protein
VIQLTIYIQGNVISINVKFLKFIIDGVAEKKFIFFLGDVRCLAPS